MHEKCPYLVLRSVHWCDAVVHSGLLSLFSFCGAALFAFHTWMHRVQKAHKHSCQPYLLCAQVIAVIFLIQPRLICMGGGIDPWPHLSAPHLFFWKQSGRSALCWNVTLITGLTTGTHMQYTQNYYLYRERLQRGNPGNRKLNVDLEILSPLLLFYTLLHMLAQIFWHFFT